MIGHINDKGIHWILRPTFVVCEWGRPPSQGGTNGLRGGCRRKDKQGKTSRLHRDSRDVLIFVSLLFLLAILSVLF